MWEVEYSREAANYLLDSGLYVNAVVQAIESLMQTEDGIPREGCTQLAFHHYLWEVADHLVYYTRLRGDHKLYVTVIKPL
jgi:hypothetical protein